MIEELIDGNERKTTKLNFNYERNAANARNEVIN